MKKACVLLAEGFEEVEALTVVDLLRRAQVYVDTVSISDDYMVSGSNGIRVQTGDLFEEVDFEEVDLLVLPGGMPGTTNLLEHGGVRRLVRTFAESGRLTAAICAAPMILGELGLLKGKRVTCYPDIEKKITGGALFTGEKVSVDGNLITSRGVGTAIDFALKLIELLEGAEKAAEIKNAIVFY